MQLIGMLDSPFVRRTAISLDLLGLRFTHQPLSVFRHFDAFAAIQPVVKAPTLRLDDGRCLIDSSLIIDYAQGLSGRSLLPSAAEPRLLALQWVGLALAVSEKLVQLVYEQNRPQDKQHAPWLARVDGQLHAALAQLETAAAQASPWLLGGLFSQADISTAVAWRFGQLVLADRLPPARYPALAALSQRAEPLPAFLAWPAE